MGKNVRSASIVQVSSQIDHLRNQKGLVFKNALDGTKLSKAISKHVVEFRDRIFNPAVTLFAFLSQVLDQDRSCRAAVAQVNAERISVGKKPASSDTGAYCKARDRLPEGLVHELVTITGTEMEEVVPSQWLWKKRHVKGVDGSTTVVADTKENGVEYGYASNQKGEKVGLPITRLVAVFSFVTGCVMDIVNGPYTGKETGEFALFRKIFQCLNSNDILVGDALYSTYFLIAALIQMRVDGVLCANDHRKIHSLLFKHFGKNDDILIWKKPARPDWMEKEVYDQMPNEIKIRQFKFVINRPGFRSKTITLISTMLDPKYATSEELGWLYGLRWHAELNLRSLKILLNMKEIPCKTPEMVRKEIYATCLAYNLIRRLMGQVALEYNRLPTQISFKATVQTLEKYRPLWQYGSKTNAEEVFRFLLEAIARHKVANRPNRAEPRKVRRSQRSSFPTLNKPRAQARMEMIK